MDLVFLQNVAIAIGLGLLVGLERQWAAEGIAGIRTFPLITVLGVVATRLSMDLGSSIAAAGLLALTAMLVVGNLAKIKVEKIDPGVTTEVAALLMFLVGGGLATGYRTTSVAVGGGVAVLLHLKIPLHRFVERMAEGEIRAILRLVLIAFIILPALPNQAYGPYGVLNPFSIWLMVVLIVGISLGAHVASRLLGPRIGTAAAGILGGLISSTATTTSYARGAQTRGFGVVAVVIVTAAGVVFARILIEIAIVAPAFLRASGPPLLLMMALLLLCAAAIFQVVKERFQPEPVEEPSSEMKAAMAFGLLYAVVLLAAAAAKQHWGSGGLFFVAALSGLTDMDAITLSTAQMIKGNRLEAAFGWRIILVAGMANLVFKGVIVGMFGGRKLLKYIGPTFGAALGLGVLLLWLWTPA